MACPRRSPRMTAGAYAPCCTRSKPDRGTAWDRIWDRFSGPSVGRHAGPRGGWPVRVVAQSVADHRAPLGLRTRPATIHVDRLVRDFAVLANNLAHGLFIFEHRRPKAGVRPMRPGLRQVPALGFGLGVRRCALLALAGVQRLAFELDAFSLKLQFG